MSGESFFTTGGYIKNFQKSVWGLHNEINRSVIQFAFEQCIKGVLEMKVVATRTLNAKVIEHIESQFSCLPGIRCRVSQVDSLPRVGRGKLQMLVQHLRIPD